MSKLVAKQERVMSVKLEGQGNMAGNSRAVGNGNRPGRAWQNGCQGKQLRYLRAGGRTRVGASL